MHFTCGESLVTTIGRVTYFVVKNVTHTHTDSLMYELTIIRKVECCERARSNKGAPSCVCLCVYAHYAIRSTLPLGVSLALLYDFY